MHILAMSLLYYVYNHHGESLKFKNLFDLVFGTDWLVIFYKVGLFLLVTYIHKPEAGRFYNEN